MSFHIFRHLENSQLIESNRTNRKTKNMHVFSKDTLKNNYKLIFHDKNSLSFLKYKTSYKNKLDTEKNFKFQNVFLHSFPFLYSYLQSDVRTIPEFEQETELLNRG